MEGEKLVLVIDPSAVNAWNLLPDYGSSLCCREIFYRMERKAGKIRKLTAHFSISGRSERVGGVSNNSNPSQRVLDIVIPTKQLFLFFHYLKNSLVIADHTCQIHWNNGLRPLCHSLFQLFIIHLIGTWSSVNQLQFRPHMADYACAGRISIGACNNLVSLSNSQQAERQFHAGCS